MKFECKNCGECCRDFGELGTLPLFNDEKKRYEELGKQLGIDVEFIPENVVVDEITGTMFCGNWGLKGNPCPFLDKNNNCLIYNHRALICKSFPIQKIPADNETIHLGCFMTCPHFNSKIFIDSKKSLLEIYGKDSVDSRLEIQEKQRNFSEKILGLISLGRIQIKKIDNPYFPDVISVEDFFEISGI